MAQNKQILLERLISTHGIAVRNGSEDDAFWYTSGTPGPFYINTENIAGEQAAEGTLEKINSILASNHTKETQSKMIHEMINQLVDSDKAYGNCINALIDYYLSNSEAKPSLISGGERRDWFFSIPVSRSLQIPHIFLFKSGEYHVTDHAGKSVHIDLRKQKTLHIADIINQASSYLKRWIPMLKELEIDFTDTLSVAVRSEEGIQSLKQHHISVISPLTVDRSLFEEAYHLGLISEFAYNEIGMFYDSPKEWTRYLLSSANTQNDHDPKVRERIQGFKTADPYQLKSDFPEFFG